MRPEEIKFGDWMRTFLGQVPPEFYIELVIRSFLVFLLLLVSMRIFGRRMAGQLNRMEMIALFSLAAAIGVPIGAPDRGILPAIVIAIIVVSIGGLIAWVGHKSEKFEKFTEGDYAILVEDGVMNWKKMRQTHITVERLLAQSRNSGIKQLGEIRRLYFEASGSFSVIREDKPRPGLSVLPAFDDDFINSQTFSDEQVCSTCGNNQKNVKHVSGKCNNCGENEWERTMM